MAIYHTEKERVEAFKQASVYPVVTTDFCAGRNPLDVVRSILEGGAKVVQVREKTMSDHDYLQLLKEARKLTDDFGALLIADDRLDAAGAEERGVRERGKQKQGKNAFHYLS